MNRFKLRHKILELLNSKIQSGAPLYDRGIWDHRPISMTNHEIATKLSLDENEVMDQVNFLRSIKHLELEVQPKDATRATSVFISLLGTEAFANKFHCTELKISRSESFKRTMNYFVIPIGIVVAILTIIGKVITTDFTSVLSRELPEQNQIIEETNEIEIKPLELQVSPEGKTESNEDSIIEK